MGEILLRQKIFWQLARSYFQSDDPRLQTSLAGIELANPIGVAAGCDKNCQFLPSLMRFGFGYTVGGTVTLEAQSGNPSPRLLRDIAQRSLTNSLGFPNQGSSSVLKNLEKTHTEPMIISVSGLTTQDFLDCFQRMEPRASGIELNISSPNSKGLKAFHEPKRFSDLLDRINANRQKPLFVKVPPFFDDEKRQQILELITIASRLGVDGITAANTHPVEDSRLKVGSGGLSGQPLFRDTLRMIREIRREVGTPMAINACGGIFSADDAIQALKVGADTIQLYTSLIYEGPGIAKRINQGISKYLTEQQLTSIREIKRNSN